MGIGSFDFRWRLECVVWRWRWQCPLQAMRTLPDPICGFFAAANRLVHNPHEYQLRKPEDKRANRADHVPIGKLQRVVGDPPWHAREAQEMLRKE